MICSLITQLSLRYKGTPRVLAALFSSNLNGERHPTSDTLLTTLGQMIREFDETFVILDALDECKERASLLEDIEEMAGWQMEKLHILVTSRRENDIKESLEPLINDENVVCIQSELVNDDVRAYVHERLLTDRGLRRWQKKPEVRQEIETTLMGKVGEM